MRPEALPSNMREESGHPAPAIERTNKATAAGRGIDMPESYTEPKARTLRTDSTGPAIVSDPAANQRVQKTQGAASPNRCATVSFGNTTNKL